MKDTRHIEERVAITAVMGDILSLFADGKKLNRSDASRALNITPRLFRKNVEALNKLGYPILSEGYGFFMATEIQQIRNSKKRLQATCNSLQKRVDAHDMMEAHLLSMQQGTNQLRLL